MARVAPDSNDILVWKLEETSGPYRNSGTLLPNNSLTDLVVVNTVNMNGPGLFGNACANFPGTSNFPAGSSATRNYASGAKTINPAPPLSVSCWVYVRTYTTGNNTTLIRKDYRDPGITSSWATPFSSIGIITNTTGGGQDWTAFVSINNTTQVTIPVTDFPIPLQKWTHIGITHDGTDIRAFINGCQCIYYTGATQFNSKPSAAPSYTDGTNGNGNWIIGAIQATGSANKEESNYLVQDVRVAGVARDLDYFRNVYKVGSLPINLAQLTQFYKLRVYDTSCVTPTPVVWVDTEISMTNAPAFPCSGPFTDIEVLDTWLA